MKPSEMIMDILDEHPDTVSLWGVESPRELLDGLAFGVSTKGYDPGWVSVRYDQGDDSFLVKVTEQEYGFSQEVGVIPRDGLFDVLNKLVLGDLGEDEIIELEKRWREEQLKEYLKQQQRC
jgi:hypothetical protein